MKLSVAERYKLQEVLPSGVNWQTLKLTRKFREALSFSEEENKLLNFRSEFECPKCRQKINSPVPVKCGCTDEGVYMRQTGRINWDGEKDPMKDVHIPDTIHTIIVSQLKQMSDGETLGEEHYTLCEKFLGDEDEQEEEKQTEKK